MLYHMIFPKADNLTVNINRNNTASRRPVRQRQIDRTLSGATTPGQSGPVSDGSEGVLCIPQSFNITGASPSDYLVSYQEHSLRESYPTVEM